MEEKPIILIVDDEEKIIEVVASYLEANGYSVFTATNGTQALELFQKEQPSLVLLDLMLPDLSGEEVCTIIRSQSRVPIIMLTAKTQERDQLYGLNIGADDYITKPFSLKTLMARIEAVLRRSEGSEKPLSSRAVFGGGDLEIDFESHTVKKAGKDVQLTPHEFKLLAVLVRYSSKVFTREELIEAAFGYEYDGYDRTIDSHIRNIRSKIEDHSRKPEYIKTVHGVGYTFGGGDLGKNPKP